MRDSLELYGHDQPSIFYTDSMADKEFLERCFPSLRTDLTPIEKYGYLPEFTIPIDVNIIVHGSKNGIDDVMRTIIDALPQDDRSGPLVVGLDSEWNVEVSTRGYVTGRGQTAILQIAFEKKVFILQIGSMLAGGSLPEILKQVLSNPRILKVGRCPSADLAYLQQCCQSSVPFSGAVDLAKLAKERLVIPNARVSLSDLGAVVLNQQIKKNLPERVGSFWEEETLTASQLQYAAVDAYASLVIYEKLSAIPVPSALSGSEVAGTPVLLFGSDRTRLLAEGTISPHATDKQYEGINITATRTVILVTKVHVPGAFILNGTSTRHQLDSFGPPPFHMVCLQSHLRQPTSFSIHRTDDTITRTPIDSTLINPKLFNIDPELPTDTTTSSSVAPDPNMASVAGIGTLLFNSLSDEVAPSTQPTEPHMQERDSESQAEGDRVLSETDISAKWPPYIRSRVIKDPFHVFNMFYISAAHGLLHDFALALRDAMFIPDKDDQARIIIWATSQKPPLLWEDLVARRPKWVWKRCKRIIPPAEELFENVSQVFQNYGPLKDAKTHLPLFNTTAWGVAKNILDLIKKGFVSDPPGIPLYYQLGMDKSGMPLYRCMRGTNMTEGGVHTHLRSRLPTSGVSIRHIQSRLLDFILRHNLLVGTFNSTGTRYRGHYSIWITNQLQEMLYLVHPYLESPRMLVGWINGNLYQRTKEVSGVLPIPDGLRIKAGMGAYIHAHHHKQLHQFLASRQGTRKPILPINNDSERRLFRELMASESGGNLSTGPNWDNIVILWNSKAEESKEISYKLPEQLKVYYHGDWKKFTNIKQTKSITSDVREEVKRTIHNPQRLLAAPPAPETTRTIHSAGAGFLLVNPGPQLQHLHQPASSLEQDPEQTPMLEETLSAELTTAHLAASRAQATQLPPEPRLHARKARMCRKCAQPTCKGKGGVNYCRNPCQDCAKVNCAGRNPKHPERPCNIAWKPVAPAQQLVDEATTSVST
ncbi:hypothetical protein CCMSSC00406_0001361 [Pleurotus cornucopiae]|uniref:Uncharacterized protein n=1 Tax=Pleurotus cornucopiae TaxID=5321 RepID=A0ACB7IKA5_PLECO|nr:hypothetical protein CCMSSC00406_0001361 [Pleurotus cornucopiae]